MTNKIIAYTYTPWKLEKVVKIIVITSLIVIGGLAILFSRLSKMDLAPVVVFLLLLVLALLYQILAVSRQKHSQQMLVKEWNYYFYKRWSKVAFVICYGALSNLPLIFLIYIPLNSTGHHSFLLITLLILGYLLLSVLRGFFELKKVEYILKTGEPVYDLYEQAKNENHENIK